jgi:hypothetical protein
VGGNEGRGLDGVDGDSQRASHHVCAPSGKDPERNSRGHETLSHLVDRAVAAEGEHRVEAAIRSIARQFGGMVPGCGVGHL